MSASQCASRAKALRATPFAPLPAQTKKRTIHLLQNRTSLFARDIEIIKEIVHACRWRMRQRIVILGDPYGRMSYPAQTVSDLEAGRTTGSSLLIP